MNGASPVHVIGASGRSGAALCRALLERGTAIVPVVRAAERWQVTGIGGKPAIADLTDPASIAAALEGAVRVVSTAHARFAGSVLTAAPTARRLVFVGSTRKFTRWPDAHGNGVLAGERAVLASGRSAVIVHPTMIYGAEGENNVRRLAALLSRLPIVPLPGSGRALVQPIHQSDVTRSLVAALDLEDHEGPQSLVIAGPAAVSYAAFVQAVAAADRQRRPRIIGLPLAVLAAVAPASGLLPFLPRVRRDEVRRLGEDKDFDISQMRRWLGIEPIALAQGLALTFDG